MTRFLLAAGLLAFTLPVLPPTQASAEASAPPFEHACPGRTLSARHPAAPTRHREGRPALPVRCPAQPDRLRSLHARAFALPAALLLLLGSGSAPFLRRWKSRRRRRAALAILQAEIERDAQRLRIRRLQLVAPDARGVVRTDRWEREKQRFWDTRLKPALARRGLDRSGPRLQAVALGRIERAARRHRGGPAGFDPAMHPLEYERFCARLLQRAGWKAQLTPASGDQGADILAERGGTLLVVQCKLYRGAVGNDAVQQVAAARAHHAAQAAIVVSNARFTAQARALARSNRVALLHHEELSDYRPERAPSDTIASATW